MDIGSIFLILALLIVVGLYVARPIFERKAIAITHEEHETSYLMAERDRILNALQELDFDFALGKIPEGDYPVQRSALVQQGAEILRRLDEIAVVGPEGDVVDRLEAAVAARRADVTRQAGVAHRWTGTGRTADVAEGGPPGSLAENNRAAPDDELEALIASRRRARQDKSAGFCPQCGRPIQQSDRFCPKCGAALK